MPTPVDPAGSRSLRTEEAAATSTVLPRGFWAVAQALVRRALGQWRTLAPVLASLLLICALSTVALWALSGATGTPMALLTRDMAATLGGKFYIGILSNAGALLWASSASVCLFAAAALRSWPAEREAAHFLAAAALLLAALGADDFFMLHEVVYPKLGLDERTLMLLYTGALGALIWRYRAVVLESEVLLLLTGGLLLAVSAAVDNFVNDATAFEDIPKFAGILFWLTYFWRLALARLRAAGGGER